MRDVKERKECLQWQGVCGCGRVWKKNTVIRTDWIRLKVWKIFNWQAIPVLLPQLESKSIVPYLEILPFAAPCGGTVIGQTGVIESTGYPDLHYQDNLLCEWFLQGPRGRYLTIRLEGLDIQNSSECANDFVEIREYNSSGLRTLSVFVFPSLALQWNLTRGSWKHFPLATKWAFSMCSICLCLPCLPLQSKGNKTVLFATNNLIPLVYSFLSS